MRTQGSVAFTVLGGHAGGRQFPPQLKRLLEAALDPAPPADAGAAAQGGEASAVPLPASDDGVVPGALAAQVERSLSQPVQKSGSSMNGFL